MEGDWQQETKESNMDVKNINISLHGHRYRYHDDHQWQHEQHEQHHQRHDEWQHNEWQYKHPPQRQTKQEQQEQEQQRQGKHEKHERKGKRNQNEAIAPQYDVHVVETGSVVGERYVNINNVDNVQRDKDESRLNVNHSVHDEGLADGNDNNESDEKKSDGDNEDDEDDELDDVGGTILANQLRNKYNMNHELTYVEKCKNEMISMQCKIDNFLDKCSQRKIPREYKKKQHKNAVQAFKNTGLNQGIIRALKES